MAHLESNRSGSPQRLARPFLNALETVRAPKLEGWLPALVACAALAAWEAGVRTSLIPELFFPPPSTIWSTFLRLIGNGVLVANLGATLQRVLLGLLLGGLPGVLLGLLMGWSVRLRRLFEPFVAAAHPLPKIAILPLIMVMFGVGESPKVIIAATGAFFPMLINTMAGVRQIHRIHFDVAQNYGASRAKVLTRVVLPGSLPLVLSGLLLAGNVTLLLTIAVEMVSGHSGLGAMIWLAWETMRVEELYASLGVITCFGIGFNLALQRLAKRIIPWQPVGDA